MSLNRYDAKVDRSQAAIVRGLAQAGVQVFVIRTPCDLLCYLQGRWRTLEVKTPTRRGRPPKRYDQNAQQEFLASTNTPVVTSLAEALAALGLSDPNLSTSATCTSAASLPATSSVVNP